MTAFDHRYQDLMRSIGKLPVREFHTIREAVNTLYNNQVDFLLITGSGRPPESYKLHSMIQLFGVEAVPSPNDKGRQRAFMTMLYSQLLEMCHATNTTPEQLSALRKAGRPF